MSRCCECRNLQQSLMRKHSAKPWRKGWKANIKHLQDIVPMKRWKTLKCTFLVKKKKKNLDAVNIGWTWKAQITDLLHERTRPATICYIVKKTPNYIESIYSLTTWGSLQQETEEGYWFNSSISQIFLLYLFMPKKLQEKHWRSSQSG